MKKFLSFLTVALILFTALASLVSCSSGNGGYVDYNKKYKSGENIYYVFKSDKTGYCEYDSYSGKDYTLSGRIDFVWRRASDGAVHLFKTDIEYYEDHTDGKDLTLISDPIYFSDEFFTYTVDYQFGSSAKYYIKEGSKLEKELMTTDSET